MLSWMFVSDVIRCSNLSLLERGAATRQRLFWAQCHRAHTAITNELHHQQPLDGSVPSCWTIPDILKSYPWADLIRPWIYPLEPRVQSSFETRILLCEEQREISVHMSTGSMVRGNWNRPISIGAYLFTLSKIKLAPLSYPRIEISDFGWESPKLRFSNKTNSSLFWLLRFHL
jgi:hypothetical protein